MLSDEAHSSQAALTHHPDKVPEPERPAAEIRFKAVQQAYEILYDDDKRAAYDRDGMSAFVPGGSGHGDDVDMEEMMNAFYGSFFGAPPGGAGASFAFGANAFGASSGPARPVRRNQVQEYAITLEEAFKGKTVKFSSTKNGMLFL
jgi:DnaJ homolog subfamily A member 2